MSDGVYFGSVAVSGADAARALVAGIADKLPRIVYWASVDAGLKARDAVKAEIPNAFDKPTPFISNSLRLATNSSRREVRLAMKNVFGSPSSDPIPRTLNPHISGGEREMRPAEKWFLRNGLISGSERLVPSRTAPLNQYGNITGARWQKIIADLGLYRFAGQTNTLPQNIQYVWGERGGVRGVWQVAGGAFRQTADGRLVAGEGEWRLILLVVRRAVYRERFDYYGIAATTFDDAFPDEFDRIFRRELAKA